MIARRISNTIPKLSLGGILGNTASTAATGAAIAGPWGAVAGAGLGLVTGLMEDNAEKEAAKKLEEENKRIETINMANRLSQYNKKGFNRYSYFAKGGTPYTKGGKYVPKNTKLPTSTEDMGLIEQGLRGIVSTPRVFNKLIEAQGDILINDIILNKKNPFSANYWNTVGNKLYNAATVNKEELEMTKDPWNVPVETANTVGNIIGGKIAGTVLNKGYKFGKKITAKGSEKIEKVLGDEASYIKEYFKRPTSRPIPKSTPKPNGINYTSSTPIIDESKLLSESTSFDPTKRLKKLHTKTIKQTPVQAKDFEVPFVKREVYTPEIIEPVSKTPNYKRLPAAKTVKQLSYTPTKTLNSSNVIYPEYNSPYKQLPARSTLGVEANPTAPFLKQRGLTETYSPGYRSHLEPNIPAEINTKVDTGIKDQILQNRLKIYLNESAYKDIGEENFFKMLETNPGMKANLLKKVGYAKGGAVPGIATSATEIPIANNVMQVKTNIPGTDKIKANIDGAPVNIDNNELVVRMSDGTPVVISHDLGEVAKYNKLLKRGVNPQKLNDIFGNRAIALQTSNANAANGYVGDNPPSKYLYYKNGIPVGAYTDAEAKSYGLPSIDLSPNMPAFSGVKTNPSFVPASDNQPTKLNSNIQPRITQTLTNNLSPIKSKEFSNNVLIEDEINTREGVAVDPNVNLKPSRFSQFMFNTKAKLSNPKTANAILAGTQILSNTVGAIENNKLKRPNLATLQPIDLDTNANNPVFEQQRSDIRRRIAGVNDSILRGSTNMNTALGRLGQLAETENSMLGETYAKQIENQNTLRNMNISNRNQIGMNNIQTINADILSRYADSKDRIDTAMGLTNSSIQSIQSLIDRNLLEKQSAESLKSIAASIGITLNDNESVADISAKIKANLGNLIGK